ncbi:Beta-galactosidase C-terminal domain [Nocardia grenadensis]
MRGVQATIRAGDGYDVLVVLNHTDAAHEIDLPTARRDLLTNDRAITRRITLAPQDVAVLGSLPTEPE